MKLCGTIVTCLLALLSAPSVGRAADNGSPKKPNFLVFIVDDMGYSDIGCYGGEIRTPHLDALAASGLRFTSFYNTARCWPTRAALMTGYYAQQVNADPQNGLLPLWTRTLPQYLKPLGYRSYHSGKWHINGAPRQLTDAGFDHAYVINDHNRHFYPQQTELDEKKLPPVKPEDGYYTANAVADYAIQFLKEHASDHAEQPFFQYVAFNTPHFPLNAPPEDIARYDGKYDQGWDKLREERLERMKKLGIYDGGLSERLPNVVARSSDSTETLIEKLGPGEVTRAVAWDSLTDEQKAFQSKKMSIHAAAVDCIDQQVGRVMDQVRQMGQLDNTVVLFLSDNGASAEQLVRGDGHDKNAEPGSGPSFLCLGPGFSTASNTPWKLHKMWVHEGGISTPLIVNWPAGIQAHGEIRHDVGHVIDFVPTFLELAGAKPPSDDWHGAKAPALPGKSLVPAFTKDQTVSRDFLFFSHEGHAAIRQGNWKLVTLDVKKGPWELYDMSKDRIEMNDLSKQEPDRARQMQAAWEKQDALNKEEAGPPRGVSAKKAKKAEKKGKSEDAE